MGTEQGRAAASGAARSYRALSDGAVEYSAAVQTSRVRNCSAVAARPWPWRTRARLMIHPNAHRVGRAVGGPAPDGRA